MFVFLNALYVSSGELYSVHSFVGFFFSAWINIRLSSMKQSLVSRNKRKLVDNLVSEIVE
jgi:hypothetical protein